MLLTPDTGLFGAALVAEAESGDGTTARFAALSRQGINNTQMRCPSCSEPLKVENKQFLRLTPPGTVDVSAIDVTVKQIKD